MIKPVYSDQVHD